VKSIRGRLTLAYAVAVGTTLLVFAAVMLTASRNAAQQALQRRVGTVAELASGILRQAGTGIYSSVVVTEDSVTRPILSAGVRRLLAALPGYVIVTDSAGPLYSNLRVERLSAKDQRALRRAASSLLSPERREGFIALDSARLLVQAHFDSGLVRGPALRVIAAESADELELYRLDIFVPIVVTFPLIFLLSVVVAWGVVGANLRPVDQLIGDLEAIQDGRSLHRRLPVEGNENELDRLTGTINAMIARLEGSFAALRRFTADASHELKTPLTVLRADIERAMQATTTASEQLPALEEALAETTRMADLVDSLLTLARADEGRFDIYQETVPLGPMMLDVFETATILGEEAGVTVELLGNEAMTAQGDPVRLRHLFLNIVTNALKYTPRGGTVSMLLERRGELAAFIVRDTGLGIAAADLPFIFERFWRADRARSRGGERGGFGLGLAIAQWIAQAHGGTINVSSRLGRGTTFTVTIPASPTA
jgi:signal transduction histidine kinase